MQEKEIRTELQGICTAQDRELASVSELVGLALQAGKWAKPKKDKKSA